MHTTWRDLGAVAAAVPAHARTKKKKKQERNVLFGGYAGNGIVSGQTTRQVEQNTGDIVGETSANFGAYLR